MIFFNIHSVETRIFLHVANRLLSEGSACPPNCPCAFAIVVYYLFRNYRSKECHAAGAEAFQAISFKSVDKNDMRKAKHYITIDS